MKWLDYVFLLVAVFLGVYLAIKFNQLTTTQIVLIVALMAIASFQFSMRRQLRKKGGTEK